AVCAHAVIGTVYFITPRLWSWVQSLSRPALIFFVTVVSGTILLLIPLRFWHSAAAWWKRVSQNAPSPSSPTPAQTSSNYRQEVYPPVQLPAVMSTFNEPAPPAQGMQLKLKRSERQSVLGKPIFVLDARMAASAEVMDKIQKYGLGGRLVYESSARQKYRDAA